MSLDFRRLSDACSSAYAYFPIVPAIGDLCGRLAHSCVVLGISVTPGLTVLRAVDGIQPCAVRVHTADDVARARVNVSP